MYNREVANVPNCFHFGATPKYACSSRRETSEIPAAFSKGGIGQAKHLSPHDSTKLKTVAYVYPHDILLSGMYY